MTQAKPSGRYLAIDYGSVRVGLALSDPLGMIASGYKTLSHKGKDKMELAEEIRQIVEAEGVTTILLGLPRRTDGKLGEKELEVREFAQVLETTTGFKPVFLDERYTTTLAHRYMQTLGVKQAKKRDIVDQIAAEILLQDFLNRHS